MLNTTHKVPRDAQEEVKLKLGPLEFEVFGRNARLALALLAAVAIVLGLGWLRIHSWQRHQDQKPVSVEAPHEPHP